MISLLERFLQTQEEPSSVIPEDELNSFIDLAVKQFDSRLSVIPGYRKKLRAPVETALLYLESLIERIPGPIEVSKSAYGGDPRVNAYFGSFEQIEHLFSHSREFREFAQNPASFGLSHGYALLLMSRQEKRRPGHVLNGDRLQCDVMQEIVVFSGHHLAAPAVSDLDTRKALRTREFGHLVAEAEQRVARHTERKADLQRQRMTQQLGLKSCAEQQRDREVDISPPDAGEHSCSELTRQLRDTELEIDKTAGSLKTINDYLELLIEVLGNPSGSCTLTTQSDCLNRANVRVEAGMGSEIPYAEMRIGAFQNQSVLVKYPLAETVDRSSISDLLHSVYQS
ncbi:MAG: hypothetical protein KDI74_12050 [Gammaproteobacteria bacterium]|nr:hypothetical protein [Gammaproteobacteria bacterium]HXK56715.1 hypothetical protein [Gammaproteobacteria bacterium]